MVKILYVEDNEDNVYMLKLRLERNHYDIIVAKNGQEGIDLATSQQPNIILMDVGLPVIDGYQATRILKNNPVTQSIPIIILTAHATIDDRDKSLSAGAEDYETKPVNIARLIEKINKQLNSQNKTGQS